MPSASRTAPHARILVVDDGGSLGEFIERARAEGSFELMMVADSGDALRRLAEEPPPDLVIADFASPSDTRARAFGSALRAQRPALPVIYMAAEGGERRPIERAREEFVAKPIRTRELLGCVYEMLLRDPAAPTLPFAP